MGNEPQCACANVIKNLLLDKEGFVDITKLEDPYDIKKVIMIQTNFRRYLANKLFSKTTYQTKINNKEKPLEEQTDISNKFPTKASKKTKKKKKKKEKKVEEEKPQVLQELVTPTDDTPDHVFDESKCPGKRLESFDNVIINPNVKNTENTLSDFIIEEKELLKYFESYPFKLKHYQIEYDNGDKYNGYFGPEWSREGFGILVHKDGTKYEGMFKAGLAEGRGRIILTKGDYYEGEFLKDKANGYGKYVSTEGEIYLGYWMNDKQHGKGELILKDGSRYEGFFQYGLKNGKGKLSWPDTSYYEGDFAQNYFEGYGIYYMRNGKVFKGQWKRGQMDGLGIFLWPDGKKYIGYYHNDKKNGYGIYIGRNGKKYEGKFLNGKQHGMGKIINEKGEMQLGLYQKGKKIKCLNEYDFKDDIEKIDKEIEKINSLINSVDFFNKDEGNKLKTGFTVDSTNSGNKKEVANTKEGR